MKHLLLCFVLLIQQCLAGDYTLVLYVDAPHLDYRTNHGIIQTIARRRKRDVGHAWIYLRGIVDDKPFSIEGGHSGELGQAQAKYFDGIMNYIEFGVPFQADRRIGYEPNPVKYLWATQQDGFFQKGSGGHSPTSFLKIDLTKEQFIKILDFIKNYNYKEYSLTSNQCCSFVAQIAALAGIHLDYELSISIDQQISLGRKRYTLWQDPSYSTFKFGCVDVLEKSLKRLSSPLR